MRQLTTERRNGSARRQVTAARAGSALLSLALFTGFAVTTANAAGSSTAPDSACAGCSALPAGNVTGNRLVEQNQAPMVNDVSGLKPAWKFMIPDNSVIEGTPVEANGLVYITSAHDDVYAVAAKTGKLVWQADPGVKQLVGVSANRGVAVFDSKVYLAGLDGHIYAFDAKTGKQLWDKLAVQDPAHQFYTQQPLVYQKKNELILGVSTGEWAGIGTVSAFDADNGNLIWSWNTIPGPGEPGHDTWSGDSWKMGGGAVWAGGSIDPSTDMLYIGVGNPQPDFDGAVRKGANLYTDSIVALDISGAKPKLVWYHQFTAHDTHDWDIAMRPVLFTAKIDGQQRNVVAVGDKDGHFAIFDAKTGEMLLHTLVTYQLNQNSEPTLTGEVTCPTWAAGIEYNGGAYDPTTNTLFAPSIDQCALYKKTETARYIPGQMYLGGIIPTPVGPAWGWFNAIGLNNAINLNNSIDSPGTFSWRHYFKYPANGGALVLSDGTNSVVFTGQLDGNFDAFNTKNGKLLWHYDTGAHITAAPTTYVEDGKRYVVVASSMVGVGMIRSGLNFMPPLPKAGPAVLTAFSLQ